MVAIALAWLLASTEGPAPDRWREPPTDQVQRGRELALQREGPLRKVIGERPTRPWIDRAFQEDAVAVGSWSDGLRKVPVESVLELSPRLMARWLGFLAERESWPAHELQARWEAISGELQGATWYVIGLAAYPKSSLLELTDSAPSKPEEIVDVRVVVLQGGVVVPAQAVELARARGRTRGEVERHPWWLGLPFGQALHPEFEPPAHPGMGDFRRRWLLVRAELVPGPAEVRVLSRTKTRVARF